MWDLPGVGEQALKGFGLRRRRPRFGVVHAQGKSLAQVGHGDFRLPDLGLASGGQGKAPPAAGV
jgi:hypothetical protein